MSDKVEPLDGVVAIPALFAVRALGPSEQADLLVVADGRDFDARASGKFTDGKHDFSR